MMSKPRDEEMSSLESPLLHALGRGGQDRLRGRAPANARQATTGIAQCICR